MSSAEALLLYTETRDWLGQKREATAFVGLDMTLESFPRPTVGIVLLGQQGEVTRISLFAKLALQRAIRHLEGRGFQISLHFIPREYGN